MKLYIKIRNEFVPIVLLDCVLVLLIAFFPVFALRVILGLPVLLLFPGYVVTTALFPAHDSLETRERLGLSLGFSVLVSTACGVIFNYSPWGINGMTLSGSVAAITSLVSTIAWWRRRSCGEGALAGIDFTVSLPGWSGSVVEKSLLVVLVGAILLTAGAIAYVAVSPKDVERFTEFMVLQPDGVTINGTLTGSTGMDSQLLLMIANHEQRAASYEIEIMIAGQPVRNVGPIILDQGQTWQKLVDFSPLTAGLDQQLSIQLLKNQDPAPYRNLRLWMNVN